MWWKHGILAITRLEQIEMAEQVRLYAQTWTLGRTAAGKISSYRKISQLVIRKKWEEVTKTQQQKLSEAFLHLSLQVYHHNMLSQMFRYSSVGCSLTKASFSLFFSWYGNVMVWRHCCCFFLCPYLKQLLGFLTWSSVLILLCEQKLGKKNKVSLLKDFKIIMEDCFMEKTAALLCKSQPSPETWVSLSHNLSATTDEITEPV